MQISVLRGDPILMATNGNIKCWGHARPTVCSTGALGLLRGLVHWRQARILGEHEKAILFHEMAINSGLRAFPADLGLHVRADTGGPGGA